MTAPVAPAHGAPAAASVWSFDAIGTRWAIETARPLPDAAKLAVDRVIDAFDREWSRFRDDSVVSVLGRRPERVAAPKDATAMLDAYVALAEATEGGVNPLVGAALERRGYDAGYSFADRGAEPAPLGWRDVLTWADGVLGLAAPAVIDVGALGKGRLVDLVLEVVTGAVGGDVVVDASGDLAVRGAPHRIGLEHPYDPRRAIGVVELRDAALCASATNRRSWASPTGETLHHVLDARTGEPVRTIAATWAIAPTAMEADAIATALFFDGGARLAHEWGVEWVRMLTDGRVEYSPRSPAELFSRGG